MKLRMAAVLAVLAGCAGGTPSAPSAQQPGGGLPYQGTRYVLDLLGGSVECGDIKNPQAGTAVRLYATMSPQGRGWVARSESGTLELYLEATSATAPLARFPLKGTIRGSADDQGWPAGTLPAIPPNGTRLSINEAIPVTADLPAYMVSGFSDFTRGTLEGTVVFSRGSVSSTCPGGAVGFTMQRNITTP